MNSIELRLEQPEGGACPRVRILVDARDLIDLLREVELPAAAAEGHPEIAGSYSGLAPEQWTELPERYGDARAAVLACECGEVGCWPLRARITRREETVVWSDFQQPHRKDWSYDALGPFVFPAAEYDDAVAAITASVA
jgi:hypothetical protein